MQSHLARHCLVEPEKMNIKATTTEKMGYVGREEGISCFAVVLLEHG
jgi:2-C-methyl-D-erythritol 2,4-cyclodiphosphate synthase